MLHLAAGTVFPAQCWRQARPLLRHVQAPRLACAGAGKRPGGPGPQADQQQQGQPSPQEHKPPPQKQSKQSKQQKQKQNNKQHSGKRERHVVEDDDMSMADRMVDYLIHGGDPYMADLCQAYGMGDPWRDEYESDDEWDGDGKWVGGAGREHGGGGGDSGSGSVACWERMRNVPGTWPRALPSLPPALAGAGPAGEAAPAAQLHVFWDLDNIPPSQVTPELDVEGLRATLGHYGTIAEIRGYGNPATFTWQTAEFVEERQARRQDMQDEDRKARATSKREQEKPYQCTMCGNRFVSELKLQKHFQQLHVRQWKKDTAQRGKKTRKIPEARKERYLNALHDVGLSRSSQRPQVDRRLEDAGVHVVKVKQAPQAADKRIAADVGSLLARLPRAAPSPAAPAEQARHATAAQAPAAASGASSDPAAAVMATPPPTPECTQAPSPSPPGQQQQQLHQQRQQPRGAAPRPPPPWPPVVVVIISDDRGYQGLLGNCRREGVRTVAVCQHVQKYSGADATLCFPAAVSGDLYSPPRPARGQKVGAKAGGSGKSGAPKEGGGAKAGDSAKSKAWRRVWLAGAGRRQAARRGRLFKG